MMRLIRRLAWWYWTARFVNHVCRCRRCDAIVAAKAPPFMLCDGGRRLGARAWDGGP